MPEQPKAVGTARLSKSGKAVMLFMDSGLVCMVSVKSMKRLLEGETPYIKIRKPIQQKNFQQ